MIPGTDYFRNAQEHFLQSALIKQKTARECMGPIVTAAEQIAATFRAGGKLLLCGNGGSAADCQHMAAEFVSRFAKDLERRALPAVALTTDSSFLTAFANDCGFEGVFERQVQALGKPGDVLIAISTSGNSANVLRAVTAATELSMRTIALTGSKGQLQQLAQIAVCVPSEDTQYIQESHLSIEHVLCKLVEAMLFRQLNMPGVMDMVIGRTHDDH